MVDPARQGLGQPAGLTLPPEVAPKPVWTYLLIWWLVASAATSLRVYQFYSYAFDLGFFTQALGRTPEEGLHAVTYMTGWGFFDDHLSPLAVVLAPLAATAGGAAWLTVIQNLAFAVALWLLYKLAKELGAEDRLAFQVVVIVSLAPSALYALWFDFHPSVLGAPFLVALLLGIHTRNSTMLWVGSIGMSLAREDMAAIALSLIVLSWRSLAIQGRYAVAPPIAMVAASAVVVDRSWFVTSGFGYVLDGEPERILGSALLALWSDGLVVVLVLSWAIPWLILRVTPGKPMIGLAPFILLLLLVDNPGTKFVGHHYYWFIPAFMAIEMARKRKGFERQAVTAAVVLSVLMGPAGLSLLDPNRPTVLDVVRSAVATREDTVMTHRFLGCATRQGLSWSGPDGLVAPAGGIASVTVLPIPFLDLRFWDIDDPIVIAEGRPMPDLVLAAGENWDRVVGYKVLALDDHEVIGRIGDDFLRVWADQWSKGTAIGCLDAVRGTATG